MIPFIFYACLSWCGAIFLRFRLCIFDLCPFLPRHRHRYETPQLPLNPWKSTMMTRTFVQWYLHRIVSMPIGYITWISFFFPLTWIWSPSRALSTRIRNSGVLQFAEADTERKWSQKDAIDHEANTSHADHRMSSLCQDLQMPDLSGKAWTQSPYSLSISGPWGWEALILSLPSGSWHAAGPICMQLLFQCIHHGFCIIHIFSMFCKSNIIVWLDQEGSLWRHVWLCGTVLICGNSDIVHLYSIRRRGHPDATHGILWWIGTIYCQCSHIWSASVRFNICQYSRWKISFNDTSARPWPVLICGNFHIPILWWLGILLHQYPNIHVPKHWIWISICLAFASPHRIVIHEDEAI